MNATRAQWLRFLIIAPFTAVTLFIFGLYFTGLNKWDMRNGVKKYLWGAVVGTTMVLANASWNLIGGTFVFGELPPFRDDRGKFSVFFTTRIKKYLREGRFVDMATVYARMVNQYDPGHFRL